MITRTSKYIISNKIKTILDKTKDKENLQQQAKSPEDQITNKCPKKRNRKFKTAIRSRGNV